MAQHSKTGDNEAGDVIEAEKGKNLSPKNLHLRLRVVEIVVLISLALNILHWVIAGANDKKIENEVQEVRQQTGVPQ